jgi:hypothetical protein
MQYPEVKKDILKIKTVRSIVTYYEYKTYVFKAYLRPEVQYYSTVILHNDSDKPHAY